jgi:hypothetical protein
MTPPPKFILVAVVAALASVLLSTFVAYQVQRAGAAEERRDCERSVDYRNDNRAMWLYLVETSTADQERIDTFVVALNEKLPPLECRDGNLVPAKP